MSNIICRLVPLPVTVKGLTVQDEFGDYNIYLNNHLTHEANQQTLQHEIQHITNNDFSKDSYIKYIEK